MKKQPSHKIHLETIGEEIIRYLDEAIASPSPDLFERLNLLYEMLTMSLISAALPLPFMTKEKLLRDVSAEYDGFKNTPNIKKALSDVEPNYSEFRKLFS